MEKAYDTASFKRALIFLRPVGTRRLLALCLAAALLAFGVTGLLNTTAGSFVGASATCTTNSSYALPSQLPLSEAPDGLSIVDDGDSYYDVYGSDHSTIAAGLNECAPRFAGIKTDATYLAYTSYNLGWYYDVARDGTGTCQLDGIKVGLRLSQIYPRLASSDAPAAITARWHTFINGTKQHEDGHAQIDKDLAAQMFDELQGLRTDCSSIDGSAKAITTRYSNLYTSENHDHDSETEYGHTQGATW